MAESIKITFRVDADAVEAELLRLAALKGVQVLDDPDAIWSVIQKHIKIYGGIDILEAEILD